MEASDNTFACACGKKYKWKAALAGKRVRCACGTVLTIPTSVAPAKTEPVDDPDDEFLLGPALTAPVAAPRAVRVATDEPRSPRTVNYRAPAEPSRFSFGSMTDPIRDLYVPLAMLAIAFVGIVIWLIQQPQVGAYTLMIVSLFVGVATLVKTAAVIGLALIFAPRIGISFGLLQTAILKFAAIIIFSDAVLLLVEVILKANGGISASGKTVGDFFWVMLGCTTTVISAASYYLFSMDMEEIATFAIPMALVTRFIGFLLNLAVIAMLAAILNHAATVRSAATASDAPPPPAVTTPVAPPVVVDMTPVDIVPTAADHETAMLVGGRDFFVPEAAAWQRKKRNTDPPTSALIDQMISAGAAKVYVELRPAAHGTVGEPFVPGRLIVELSNAKGQRQACFDAASAYLQKYTPDVVPTTEPLNEQFLIVNLKR